MKSWSKSVRLYNIKFDACQIVWLSGESQRYDKQEYNQLQSWMVAAAQNQTENLEKKHWSSIKNVCLRPQTETQPNTSIQLCIQ